MADTRPVHLPHIWNSCLNAEEEPCVLNVTTVTQNVYNLFDEKLDTGFPQIAATEIRMKLKSRQSFMEISTNENASKLDISETDPDSTCQSINEQVYEQALKLVESKRLEFYHKYGVPMVFGKDYNGLPGPGWIYNPLSFKLQGEGEDRIMRVVSPSSIVALDSFYNKFSPLIKGMHYCKIISPARVLEWVYSDSLVYKLGYNSDVVYHLDAFY